jgi:hypothetical protein
MTTDDTLLAESPLDDHDRVILTALRDLHIRMDPVPHGLTGRVKFELTLAALHAEIAELERPSFAGVRQDSQRYTLTESVTFTSSTLSLMVSFGPGDESVEPAGVRVDGWVTGGGTVVELRVGDRSLTATADDHGRFVMDNVPHGPARFILKPVSAGDRPVITPVIEL